jgi:hypothetical protein
MTWHSETVTLDVVDRVLVRIHRTAGMVVRWERMADRVPYIWTTGKDE